MSLFQHISKHIRLSSEEKKVRQVCQRLFDSEHVAVVDMHALISMGEGGISAFQQLLASDQYTLVRKEKLIALLGAVDQQDQHISTVIALLLSFIDDGDSGVATKAVHFLAHFSATDALLKALQNNNTRTRSSAVKALGRCADVSIIPKLIESLADDDVRVRNDIVTVLGAFSDGRVTEALLTMLADPNWQVRESSSAALSVLDENDILPQLECLMEHSQHVRVQVVRTISRMDSTASSPKALTFFISALDDEYIAVQSAAVDALAVHPNRAAIEPLLLHFRQADQSLRKKIHRACEKVGMQRVLMLLSHDDHNIRIAVAEMMAQWGDSSFLPLLNDAWQYEVDIDVQMWIVIAIGQLAIQLGHSSSDASIKVLIQAAESEYENVIYHAKKALEALPHPLAEHFIQAPLQPTKVSISCPNCLEILALDPPLTGKDWYCPHCFLGFTMQLGADGAMLISAIASKLKANPPSSAILPWFEVLGVSSNADTHSIKSAFRKLLKQYHPDKVAMLGDEFKVLAEEKTRLLTWALRAGLKKV